ncbi:MAG: hypothetical protein DMG67_00525 [Acidobacteria bacterium]|nr:MAG: hypothetical protein DMG67_00525 [Acidobacteriota bacterium]
MKGEQLTDTNLNKTTGVPVNGEPEGSTQPISASRRSFLKKTGFGAAAALTAGALAPVALMQTAAATEIIPTVGGANNRARQLVAIRTDAANEAARDEIGAFPHPTNGDEERYEHQQFVGNFFRSFPLDSNGLVNPNDYQILLMAVRAGTKDAFDNVPQATGGTGKLLGPLDGQTFNILGPDSPGAITPAFAPLGLTRVVPPSIASAQGAAEMVELYWEAYCRDVPFIDFATNPIIARAVADIAGLSGYQGPKPVTPQTIFRYQFTDALNGPYVSQFLLLKHRLDGVDFVPRINTRARVADPNTGQVLGTGFDYMTNLSEYLNAEQTVPYSGSVTFDPIPRYIRSMRDLGQLATSDSIYSLYFRAAVIANAIGVPVSPNNPFALDTRVSGFGTFGLAHLLELIAKATAGERHAFYYKWYVHRKLRPEAFGNVVDGTLGSEFGGTTRFSINPALHSDLTKSSVLPLIFERNRQLNALRGYPNQGSLLHAQELATSNQPNTMILSAGSPTPPASPAGHATSAMQTESILQIRQMEPV